MKRLFRPSACEQPVCRASPRIAAAPRLLLMLALAGSPLAAQAQRWTTETSLGVIATATTNGNLAPSGDERKDLVTALSPSFVVDAEGLRYKLRGRLGLDLVDYARGSQRNRVVPTAEADFAAALVERIVFLDSSFDVRSAQRDPFAAREGNLATSNSRTEVTYRLSPFVQYEASPVLALTARHDLELSESGSDALADRRFTRTRLGAERRPGPYGGAIEISTQDQRYSGTRDEHWKLDALLLKGDISIDPDLVVGPLVLLERSEAFGERTDHTGAGGHLRWSPNERMLLAGAVQQRFFGTGWELSLRHRMPLMSFQVEASRTPVTSAGLRRSRLSTFLDAILTTRYPNGATRVALVRNIMDSGGLHNELANAAEVVASYPQVQSGAHAVWVYLASRNTVSVSAYQQTLRTLSRSPATTGTQPPVDADNRQVGAAIELNRKLTPQLSVGLTSSWARITGLGDRDGDESMERVHRLTVTRRTSLRTGVSTGLQYRKLTTQGTGTSPFAGVDAFVGLSHRF